MSPLPTASYPLSGVDRVSDGAATDTDSFRFLDIGCDADILGEFGSLKEIWDRRRADRTVPSWRAFHITDFEGWFTHMARSEATKGRDDILFRYFGSGLVDLNGADYTGRTFSDIAPDAYEAHIRRSWTHFFEKPQIAIGRARALNRKDHDVFFDMIILPLSEDDKTVSGAINFSQRVYYSPMILS